MELGIRYRGYYLDSETGWYFLNARYYSPEWRRFISPDDTAYLDPKNVNGCNLYCYCGNDPVNFVDPSGHFDVEITNTKPLAEQFPQLILLCLGTLWGLWELFCESLTWDIGFGAGVGFDVEVFEMLGLGAIYRQDLITFEKEAGPATVDNIKFGQKVEKYIGATTPFGFAGKGEEDFYYFFTPEYNYSGKAIESDLTLSLSVGVKLYWGIGASISLGWDLGYLFYGLFSGQWYK